MILSSDHGGHGTGHSGSREIDYLIPWIVRGPGIRGSGRILPRRIHIFDTAPTALALAGVPIPPGLDGRVVREALDLAEEEEPSDPPRPVRRSF